MEYIIGAVAVMAPIIVYLYFQLLKSKAQKKEIEKELRESKRLRKIFTDKGFIKIDHENI